MASRRAPGLENAFALARASGVEGNFPHVEAHETAAELVALLNAELRKQDACTGVSVEGVTPLADEKVAYTWTATALRRSGGPIPGQCARFFVAALRLLQQRYDLLPEEDL